MGLIIFISLFLCFRSTVAQGPGCVLINCNGGVGYNLDANSTCTQMANEQNGAPNKAYQNIFWTLTQTNTYFSNWQNDYKGEHFEQDFVSPWGLGQSWACSVTSGCTRPDCNSLGELKNKEGSAAAYQVMLSMANLGEVLKQIYHSIEISVLWWAARQAEYTQIFNPGHPPQSSNMWLVQLLNAFGTIGGVATTLSGNPAAAGAGVFVQGVIGGINAFLSESSKDDKSDLARVVDLAGPINKYLNGSMTHIKDEMDAFFNHGQADNMKMSDLFTSGVFADSRDIPLLDTSILTQNQKENIFQRLMSAMVINTAWHQQRVWLMAYPMTLDEFNSKVAPAGDNDSRLKGYFQAPDGRMFGYYFQSVYPDSGPFDSSSPMYQNPPGWAEASDIYGIPTSDIILSSIRSQGQAGYKGDLNIDWQRTLLENGNDRDAVQKFIGQLTSYASVFRVPICFLDPSSGIGNVDDFLKVLIKPGERSNSDYEGAHRVSSFCYCLDRTDQFGVKFRDIVDVGNWQGGSNSFCEM
ncbi:hypothetical protein BCR34DRAFT_600887 [Clohesyomyces aquaticus]|uniref:Uncharacterized protein n=1 Tax=Clohesyomyces aquaticus TaxID=1231657 RepID=A0A1Y1ZPF9_9PLEO|nr:hypothetical protein BCR34DRAFT_600887 [Clohesyomyces aquaticus]